MKELTNIVIFLGLCFITYFIFRSLPNREGLTTGTPTFTSGVAGGAAAYADSLKMHAVKHQDTLLISKYRGHYENAVLNLDDLVDHLMLHTALNVDPNDHDASMDKLAKLHGAKSSLNNIMKFMDSK